MSHDALPYDLVSIIAQSGETELTNQLLKTFCCTQACRASTNHQDINAANLSASPANQRGNPTLTSLYQPYLKSMR